MMQTITAMEKRIEKQERKLMEGRKEIESHQTILCSE